MFACIYGQSVSSASVIDKKHREEFSPLVELAFTFSPLVEETTIDTVVFDVSGQDLLFGQAPFAREAKLKNDSMRNIGNEIARRTSELNLQVIVAIAANPDAAIHAARCFKELTVIDPGDELSYLGSISIEHLDYSLAQVEPDHAEQIQETFALWGVRTFADLARLPLSGVAERLGQEGVRLQKLAQGHACRHLNLVRPPIGFEQTLELEHHVTELEPLSFIMSRLLNQLCANLREYALATNELRLRLVTESRAVASGSSASLDVSTEYERAITLPIPMCNPKTLLRLLLFEIEREPPTAPVTAVTISAEPVKPHASQTGLFIPLAPEPETLEITLARLAKLVGVENVGSPEILDTHRPDAFRMNRFTLKLNHRGHRARKSKARTKLFDRQSSIGNRQCAMGFRIFRPAWHADVRTQRGIPRRIHARNDSMSNRIRGDVVCAAGPWRASGDWWRSDAWARDEWDVAVLDPAREIETLCRIYRDLTNEQWFVAGIYD